LLQRIEAAFDARPPKTIGALRDLIVNYDAINEVVFGILSRALGGKSTRNIEYQLTYALRTDGIVRVFVRELENRWGQAVSDGEITKRAFREYAAPDLRRYLLGVARGVVTATVTTIGAIGVWTEHEESLKEYFVERKEAQI